MIPHFRIRSFLQHAYGYYSHFRFGLAIIAASLRRFSHPTLRCFLFASKVALTSSSDLRKTEGFYACDDILRLSLKFQIFSHFFETSLTPSIISATDDRTSTSTTPRYVLSFLLTLNQLTTQFKGLRQLFASHSIASTFASTFFAYHSSKTKKRSFILLLRTLYYILQFTLI